MRLVKLSAKQIDECFEGKTSQADVVIAIYRIVFPQWDEIQQISGWPRCNKNTGKYIWRKFIEFDQQHSAGVIAGGLWCNKVFGSDDSIPDWKVSLDGVSVSLVRRQENSQFNESDCGGAFDGFSVSSDADPGL
mgnify:CR=1 FL=1